MPNPSASAPIEIGIALCPPEWVAHQRSRVRYFADQGAEVEVDALELLALLDELEAHRRRLSPRPVALAAA